MLVAYQIFDQIKSPTTWQSRLDVMDAASGRVVASLPGGPNDHLSGYFAPDGQILAAIQQRSKEPKLILFSVPKNRIEQTISLGSSNKGERGITGNPAFSPDGKRLALTTRVYPDNDDRELDALDLPQPRIHLIDVATGEIRDTLIAPQGFGDDLCFSPDGRLLASTGQGRVLLWDVSK
jgi:Tol biopolymer transport system component